MVESKADMAMHDDEHVRISEDYALNVLSGKIEVPPFIVEACEKFLNEQKLRRMAKPSPRS